MANRRDDLTTPRARRRLRPSYDSESFGRFSEQIARFFGTARFLIMQTGIVAVWILANAILGDKDGWDPYPFILLNLAFSTQAAYAAPLILLAQTRQEARDKTQAQLDREVGERTQADTEFLAREIAGARLMISDVVTGDELDDRLTPLIQAIDRLTEQVVALSAGGAVQTSRPGSAGRGSVDADQATPGTLTGEEGSAKTGGSGSDG